MSKPKPEPRRHISRTVLRTELRVAMESIENMNFGSARYVLEQILERVNEYDLPGGAIPGGGNPGPADLSKKYPKSDTPF